MSSSDDQTLRIWALDPQGGLAPNPQILGGHHLKVTSAIELLDGSLLSGDDEKLSLWKKFADGSFDPDPFLIPLHSSAETALRQMPDGKVLVNLLHKGEVEIWDPKQKNSLRSTEIALVNSSSFRSIIPLSDGRILVPKNGIKEVWEPEIVTVDEDHP
jgi:WD40 repeat protein